MNAKSAILHPPGLTELVTPGRLEQGPAALSYCPATLPGGSELQHTFHCEHSQTTHVTSCLQFNMLGGSIPAGSVLRQEAAGGLAGGHCTAANAAAAPTAPDCTLAIDLGAANKKRRPSSLRQQCTRQTMHGAQLSPSAACCRALFTLVANGHPTGLKTQYNCQGSQCGAS